MGKLENKFGKYAIRNLSLILVIGYGLGYLIQLTGLTQVLFYLTLDPYKILHGQVWRLVTWIIIPPSGFSLLTLITLFFYWSIGRSLERAWGDWLYNVYIFSGMIFTAIGSFIILAYFTVASGSYETAGVMMQTVSGYFSTYYVNMSIFLAFAATFPDSVVLLMFFIPIKVKWLGIIYGGFLIYQLLSGMFAGSVVYAVVNSVVIIASLLNFGLFFFYRQKLMGNTPRQRFRQAVRHHEYTENYKQGQMRIAKHKCAICGRTDEEYPDLEFRFCSKCNGNYEYCSEHLFTHKHVE
ncbi:MAG: hypothetical protein K5868_03435 [Lachnospiraceae bacterium]|nr:hypothetical protein [Lachnospiraceae bacterium]